MTALFPRTSLTDPLRIAELPAGASGGVVGVTFCPGKYGDSDRGRPWARDLEADLDVVQRWGARAVLTLIEGHEIATLGVPTLGERIASRGIDWHHLPIVDGTAPGRAFERNRPVAGRGAVAALTQAGKVLVHCRGGLGRAGTVAACLLIEFGTSPRDAILRTRAARPGAIETPEQERYVDAYRARFGR
jgi:protein-tyrosine phosphatase